MGIRNMEEGKMAPDLSVDVRSPGARSGTRQHRKRAELADTKLKETYEVLKRNKWNRPLTMRSLLITRESLNSRIRVLKRQGCEIPDGPTPKEGSSNKAKRYTV